jgi:hypothetical protein
MSRAELGRILARYRHVDHVRWRYRGWQLTWFGAGRVWTMDFVEHEVDLDFPAILAIRDLASGYQLAWLPVTGLTAEAVIEVLGGLFTRYDAPLVLKSDNGSAFIAENLGALLTQWRVIPLFSPPRTPNYNGSGERAHQTLKQHTEVEARHQGRPGDWSAADLEAALSRINHFDRPWGANGPNAAEVWDQRTPITPEERTAFQRSVEVNRQAECARREVAADQPLHHRARAKIDRQAVPEALVTHGYLTVERADGKRHQRSSGDGLPRNKDQAQHLPAPIATAPSAAPALLASPSGGEAAPFTPTRRPARPTNFSAVDLQKNQDASAHVASASCRIDPAVDARRVPSRPQPCLPWRGLFRALRRIITPLFN